MPVSSECAGDFSLIFGPYPYGPQLNQVALLPIRREGSEIGLIGILPVFVMTCTSSSHDGDCALVNGGRVFGRSSYRFWGDESKLPPNLPAWSWFPWRRTN